MCCSCPFRQLFISKQKRNFRLAYYIVHYRGYQKVVNIRLIESDKFLYLFAIAFKYKIRIIAEPFHTFGV